MKFNYRDFFITNNDDLNIIKEQLSIVDEAAKKDDYKPNAKTVWDMYQTEPNEQKIADKLKINVESVKKIIQICLMSTINNKNANTIANELGIPNGTVTNILNYILGSERKRETDQHFVNDAVKIYYLHKNGKTPEEIVDLVNNGKGEDLEKITVDKVELVLKIVDIAKEQMEAKGEVNATEIRREIGGKISRMTITRLIKKLNLGNIQYHHKFTEEQDAFILHFYLQRNGTTEIARKFNEKFSTESKKLNIIRPTIGRRLSNYILNPKDKGESEISEYVSKLLNKYKTEYFSTVDINDPKTKEMLTRYTPPERIKGRDSSARKGGKVDSTRQISGQFGNLEPDTHQTFTTGETPASGQLGRRYGAPNNPQGAIGSL